MILSPEVIVLGGGILNHEGMLEKVHRDFKLILNEYVIHSKITDITNYIKKPALGDNSALFGATLLNEKFS